MTGGGSKGTILDDTVIIVLIFLLFSSPVSEESTRRGRRRGRVTGYNTCHLADAFIQSDLQLIRLSRRHCPLEQCGVKGLAHGPNSCADLIMAAPGIEPPMLRFKSCSLNITQQAAA